MVLATTEYRRAYAGKIARVLAGMVDGGRLVWIGFSFTDQRISTILREVAEHAGTRSDPGRETRHVAVMAWDPGRDEDPATLRTLAEIDYGSELVLYPAPDGDHSALTTLLEIARPTALSAGRSASRRQPLPPRRRPPDRRAAGCTAPTRSGRSSGGSRNWPGSTAGPSIPPFG